ncbi:Hypothetical protein PHPALM_20263 [Phytophthora palmivora]|uniref:Uncharacterized protein n=1 Tax=Phytophthora palmivora TaxID=4796 RepID=A0A2P4XFB7_9STRA|nr:Hypothetical protein PHPALM_20263 [Phytophthora palmivora]
MRSPTKIRTPTKLVRPRETHWVSRTKDVKKRLLETGEGHLESSLPPPKRMKLMQTQNTTQTEIQASRSEAPGTEDVVEASQETKEGEGYTGYADRLHRQVEVAQCLEKDLLRDNARMRLKVLNLRDEVDFYYGILARIEHVTAQQREESEGTSNQTQEQVTKLVEQLQRVISASKPVETSKQTENEAGEMQE